MTRAEPAATRRRGGVSARRALLGLLIAALSAVALAVAASTIWPSQLEAELGYSSSGLAWALGAASALGVALTPLLGTMGRVGAIMLALPVAVFSIANAVRHSDYPGAPTGTALDILLNLLIPAGYFVLLFGALRAAGWARAGSAAALVGAAALSVAIWVVPVGPMSDVDMSSRMVSHGLINAGIIVAAAALLFEVISRRSAGPLARAEAVPQPEDAASREPSR